jgi:translation initiation factor IF-1
MVEKNMPVERERLVVSGTVIDASNSQFKVETADGHTALCTVAGKMRVNGIKILCGDTVECELSPYDLGRGRIIRRLK